MREELELMDGYWPSSFLRFYWPRREKYTAILIEQAWSINGINLLYGQKDNIFLGTNGRNPEAAWLATGTQDLFDLASHGFSHKFIG